MRLAVRLRQVHLDFVSGRLTIREVLVAVRKGRQLLFIKVRHLSGVDWKRFVLLVESLEEVRLPFSVVLVHEEAQSAVCLDIDFAGTTGHTGHSEALCYRA